MVREQIVYFAKFQKRNSETEVIVLAIEVGDASVRVCQWFGEGRTADRPRRKGRRGKGSLMKGPTE